MCRPTTYPLRVPLSSRGSTDPHTHTCIARHELSISIRDIYSRVHVSRGAVLNRGAVVALRACVCVCGHGQERANIVRLGDPASSCALCPTCPEIARRRPCAPSPVIPWRRHRVLGRREGALVTVNEIRSRGQRESERKRAKGTDSPRALSHTRVSLPAVTCAHIAGYRDTYIYIM